MAVAKKTTTAKVSMAKETVDEPVVETKAPEVKKPKKFEKDELIPCRSVTPGMLLYNGQKSGIPYTWTSSGDVAYLEYQDLLAGMVMRSDYIYDPLFVIEDEEVLEDPKWIEVKKLYESMEDAFDVNEILSLPLNLFRKTLTDAPKGVRNAVKSAVATQIAKGTFDSFQKVKIIDEVCGTDLQITMK